jgi:hypothetical protein
MHFVHVVALPLMDAAGAKKLATYDDLAALPRNLVGEIVDGDLYASPRPASPHARAASVLGGELGGPSTGDAVAPVAGSSSTSRSFMSAGR